MLYTLLRVGMDYALFRFLHKQKSVTTLRHPSSFPKSLSTFRGPCPPRRILIKALATLPPRLGMAEYGLGIGFKGKAFIKIR